MFDTFLDSHKPSNHWTVKALEFVMGSTLMAVLFIAILALIAPN